MPTTLAFVRGGEGEGADRVYVTRVDGPEESFRIWPSVAGLPHDLAHLVVETGMGLVLGFWGLVAAGGRPTAPVGDHDPTQLLQAEIVVNVLTGYGSQDHTTDADRTAAVTAACQAAAVIPPPGVDEATIARLRAALTEEATAWVSLPRGTALCRRWPPPAPDAGPREPHEWGPPS